MQEFTLSPLMAQFAAAKAAGFEVALAESLAEPPALQTYLDKIDPALSLDWSGESFWGLPALRQRILDTHGYNTGDTGMNIDNVLLTAGSAEAIYLTLARTLEPGDEIIVETPGWQQPLRVAPGLGAHTITWPRVEAQGWALDLERLPRLITRRTRLIYLSNPNNPTGHITERAELNELIRIADQHGLPILSDEVYRGLEWNNAETPRLAECYPRGISVGSVSKLFGMQGLRMGWMISQNDRALAQAFAMRANSTEIVNVLGEAIALAALEPANYHIVRTRNRAIGRAARATLHRLITETSLISWHPPQGGYLGFARSLRDDGDQLAQKLLAPPYRLWVIPGSVYDYPNHIRLGLGGKPAQVEQALARLARYLHEHAQTAHRYTTDRQRTDSGNF